MSTRIEQLSALRAWFAGSVGEAFREASAIVEPAGSSPAWAAICARHGVALVSDVERGQIRAAQRPTRGAPVMEVQEVVAAIVRGARHGLADLRIGSSDAADALHDAIRRAVDDAETDLLRAYRAAVLPKRTGGMFANATAHASKAAAGAPGSTALSCRHCGAPQLEAGVFDCKYCGNRMV